jgi:hypothetical protein
MTTNCNLTLDIDQEGGGREPSRPTARIAVSDAWGFTRHGGAATVTRDCTSYAALEREVARLRGELDAALSEARARFGGAVRTAAGAQPLRPRPRPNAGSAPSTRACAWPT